MTTIVQAVTEDEIADVHRLMRAFATWRREQLRADFVPHENYLESRAIDQLGELPETYAPPRGRLLIAYEADQAAGCAVLCDLGDGVCEVKRIFVTARFRGQRMGRALVERLLMEARAAGYRRVRLDTSIHDDEAMRLCERAGFHRTDVDQEPSDGLPGQHVLFEKDLRLAG